MALVAQLVINGAYGERRGESNTRISNARRLTFDVETRSGNHMPSKRPERAKKSMVTKGHLQNEPTGCSTKRSTARNENKIRKVSVSCDARMNYLQLVRHNVSTKIFFI